MTPLISPQAHIAPSAVLGEGTRVGAFAVIGDDVVLGRDCEVGAQAQIQGPSRLGDENVILGQTCIGFDPQDKKYNGEEVFLEVGNRNIFREYTTINRGTAQGGGTTLIGDDNFFLTGSHVGHDCQVGSRTLFVNNSMLAGHVVVQDDATVGALSAVHQFCRVGEHAYIGGGSIVTKDALPFATTVGHSPRCYGANKIGLERKGFTPEEIKELQQSFKILLRSKLNTTQAMERLAEEFSESDPVQRLMAFISGTSRGVIKAGDKGGRGV